MKFSEQIKQSVQSFDVLSGDALQFEKYINQLAKTEFSSKFENGYGDSYTHSVTKVPYAKNIGIKALFSLLGTSAGSTMLDVFGGSGQLKVAIDNCIAPGNQVRIITADLEMDQVEKSVRKGFPALALDASDMSIVKSGVMDSVVFAYGFHHLSPENRPNAIAEAVRITKPGGRVIIHDGMNGGITHRLSHGVIDLHGTVPHKYEHPHREEMVENIEKQSIRSYSEHDIFDPHVFFASSQRQAEKDFSEYYIHHYSLPTWDFARIKGVIDAIYGSHVFEGSEKDKLVSEQQWVKGKPYTEAFYVGETDEKLRSETFGSKPFEKNETSHCAAVGRYAKVFALNV